MTTAYCWWTVSCCSFASWCTPCTWIAGRLSQSVD